MTSTSFGVIGRASELATCRQLLDAPPPWVGILTGPPGIGKTTLWEAAVESAAAAGWRVLATRPAERERDLSDRVLIELLSDVTTGERSQLPQAQAGAIAALLQRRPEGRPDRLTLIFSIRSLIDTLTESGTRVLVAIDDAQWIDPESGDVLSALLTAARPVHAGVLLSIRSSEENALPFERFRLPIVPVDITVSALDFDVCCELVRARFGGGWSQTLLRAIWESAAGNPLTLLELARAMADRRTQPVPTTLPLTGLGDALDHHLNSLPASAQHAATTASVLSRPTRSQVRKVAEACAIDVDIDAAIGNGVLVASDQAGGLAFSHPLLRSAAYGRMQEGQRRIVHAAAARISDSPSERAWHLAETVEGPDEGVAAELEDAARQLLAAGALLSSVPLAERSLALTLSAKPDDVFRRRLLLVDALGSAGDVVRARMVGSGLLETAHPGRERAEALWRRAMHLDAAGPLQDAIDDIDAALRELGWTPETIGDVSPADRPLAVSMLQDYAGATGIRGNQASALSLAKQAAALANASGDRKLQAAADRELGNVEFLVSPSAATARLSRWIDVWETYDEQNFYAWPQSLLGMQAMFQGRLDDARHLLEEVVRRVSATGSLEGQAHCDFHLAELRWREGRWDEAHRLANRAINVFREAGRDAAPGYVLGLVETCRGETRQARQRAHAWKQRCLSDGDMVYAVTNGWVEGLALLFEGDSSGAAAVLTEIDTFRPEFAEVGIFAHLPDAVEALLQTGRRAEAEARIRRLTVAAETIDNHLWAQATALRCHGLLLSADHDDGAATDVLREATVRARAMGAPLETARTLLAYGGTLRRTRQRSEAGAALAESVFLFQSLGAVDWQRKAEAELSRAVPGRGNGGLTPTERAVAELAADGLSNRDIALKLVVSVKTVEANLTRVYAKLGVRSRAGLARHLGS
jgi:ATP/maltotriose-dependent transcriptional regulator MalT